MKFIISESDLYNNTILQHPVEHHFPENVTGSTVLLAINTHNTTGRTALHYGMHWRRQDRSLQVY
jgi:hypothetical protein